MGHKKENECEEVHIQPFFFCLESFWGLKRRGNFAVREIRYVVERFLPKKNLVQMAEHQTDETSAHHT